MEKTKEELKEQIDTLKAQVDILKSLITGVSIIVELMEAESESQIKWKESWLDTAKSAMAMMEV